MLRRDGRVVDYNGLENRRAERHRGFESLSLRNPSRQKSLIHKGLATFFVCCPRLLLRREQFFGGNFRPKRADFGKTFFKECPILVNKQ